MAAREIVDLESQLKALSLNKFNFASDKGSELTLSINNYLCIKIFIQRIKKKN